MIPSLWIALKKDNIMCCNLKHLQRCDTCLNSIKHCCYGYDQGLDCYVNIFEEYSKLEERLKSLMELKKEVKPHRILGCPEYRTVKDSLRL
jgi:hypothetical protein